jgi:hypothetical protein
MAGTSGLSRAVRQALLDHFFSTSPYTAPTDIWVGLFTVTPTATGGGTEVAEASYNRIKHDAWNAASAAEPSVATNDGEILFDEALTSWGAIVAFGLFDAKTSGNFLGYGTCSKTIGLGDIARFADTALQVKLNES